MCSFTTPKYSSSPHSSLLHLQILHLNGKKLFSTIYIFLLVIFYLIAHIQNSLISDFSYILKVLFAVGVEIFFVESDSDKIFTCEEINHFNGG